MLILHAAQVEGDLVLWGEVSEAHLASPARQTAGKHPYCAQAQLLAEAIGLETGDSNVASAIAWLPTLGGAPVPSSPMAGPMPKSRAKARIRPWTVTALKLTPEQAFPLLQMCHQRRVLIPGVAIGADLAYWTHALRLTVSLTARQQFLPGLSQRDGGDPGNMDSGVHRRRGAPASRADRTDAGAGQGADWHWGHRTARHSGSSRPPGVHCGSDRPPGTRGY